MIVGGRGFCADHGSERFYKLRAVILRIICLIFPALPRVPNTFKLGTSTTSQVQLRQPSVVVGEACPLCFFNPRAKRDALLTSLDFVITWSEKRDF
jgi:hypothetical protein